MGVTVRLAGLHIGRGSEVTGAPASTVLGSLPVGALIPPRGEFGARVCSAHTKFYGVK